VPPGTQNETVFVSIVVTSRRYFRPSLNFPYRRK
jgi:hypothetical protein